MKSFWRLRFWRPKSIRILVGGYSEVGPVRSDNQDSFGWHAESDSLETPAVFVVADGMGGLQLGREASEMTVAEVMRQLRFDPADARDEEVHSVQLRNAMDSANSKVREMNVEAGAIGGTTCSVLVVTKEETLIGHIGDSRIYRVQDSSAVQITSDHTVVAESGGDVRGVSASMLSRALGVTDEIDPQVQVVHPLDRTTSFVLCSDGLYRHAAGAMAQIVRQNEPQQAARKLVKLAIQNGSTDNVTAVVVKAH